MEALRRYARGVPRQGNGLHKGIHLLVNARSRILEARSRAALVVHASMLELYWDLGQGIRQGASAEKKALREGRADSLIATLARALTRLYGRDYSEEALRRMVRFAECYPTKKSLEALAGLRWSHVVALLALADPRERDFYVVQCRKLAWSPLCLREQIKALAYAHSAWSRDSGPKPEKTSPGDTLPQSLADPDLSGFMGCADGTPRDARSAVIQAMEEHILNLEAGFCFVERWKRFQVGPDDFHLDLVLYHRRLKCLFALVFDFGPHPSPRRELMDFYLTWLNLHERQPGENPPAGIVFDADAQDDRLSIRHLERENARVAWYQTGLPPRTLLHQFFLQAVAAAREEGGLPHG